MGIIKAHIKQQHGAGRVKPSFGAGRVKPSFGEAFSAGKVKPSFGGAKGKGGAKGGFGGGKGGGAAGGWVFVPAGASMPAPWAKGGRKGGDRLAPWAQSSKGGSKGGNKGGSKGGSKGGNTGKGFGKGSGKNLSPKDAGHKKVMDKLGRIEADRKVWVGGLPEDVTRGALVKHIKEVSNPSVLEIMRKGSACIAFKTAEDAQSVIDSLNGSDLDGSTLEVDVWTQKEKKERPERAEGEKGQGKKQKKKHNLKTDFLKKKPTDSKMKDKLKTVDNELKTWVGGLSKTTTWKQLKTHFTELGCEVDIVDLMKPGTAVVTFKTDAEATSAISIANGTDLDGKTIQVDVWQKPERKNKKADLN